LAPLLICFASREGLLEQIYAKLGVEERTAAAAIATNARRRNS
jgi:hypothetical protein